MRVALAQIRSGTDPAANLALVEDYTQRAADAGAQLVLFPEATMCRFGVPLAPVAEPLDVLVVGAGEEIEERIEAAIQRAPQLRNRPVEGVERQPGRRAVGELQRRFVDAFQGAFRDQPDAVDERVSSHGVIVAAARIRGRRARARVRWRRRA